MPAPKRRATPAATARDLIPELGKQFVANNVAGLATAQTAAGAAPTTDADFAELLTSAARLPEMVTFIGYLGSTVSHPSGANWLMLYLDWQLRNWLLVENDGILFETKLRADGQPFGQCDVIWVDAGSSVGSGDGPQSVEARFLTGEFTRAGDFDAAPAGGTSQAPTGVFCRVRTQTCCRRASN
jgi:hypothetical protein